VPLRVFYFCRLQIQKLTVHAFHVVEEKTQSPCPFASVKKPLKRKKLSNFDDHADVLAASDRDSFFEQKRLITPDEEEQS